MGATEPTPRGTASALAEAHARFARAAVGIYLAAALAALALVVGVLTTERSHEEDQLRDQLFAEANLRGHYLVRYLDLLVQQLRRLGLRSEVSLLDKNLQPERSLVSLSHQRSTAFNLGVAILGTDGQVLWEEPEHFLPRQSFADRPWFLNVERGRAVHIVPVEPERAEDAILYVVSPIVRANVVTGALLGAVDLKHGEVLTVGGTRADVSTVLATRGGQIVYPPAPPPFAHDDNWQHLFAGEVVTRVTTVDLAGTRTVVATSPVEGTELQLSLLAPENELLRDARRRIQTRLALALVMAAVPLAVLIALLNRSIATFRRSEEQAVREERLRRVGEAANLIAHEVKNSLNGIRMAAELACDDRAPGRSQALQELRGEISRLTNFTAELMTFSKGISPRKVKVDLREFVPKVTSLLEKSANEAGVEVALDMPEAELECEVDPQLLHIVLSNLVTNAIEAVSVSATDNAPHIDVRLGRDSADPNGVRLEVADNGPGLAKNIEPQLFEPFHSGKPSGVGIGLALSQRIARAHGGQLVYVPSARGATFVLTLPGGTA
jgi:two-component system C4-dicarboxylate transport sensor histidine kinase DctB